MDIVKGQPLTLPNGDVLLPDADADGSKLITKDDIDEREALDAITEELSQLDNIDTVLDNLTVVRTLADINIPFDQMNVFMLVAAYKLWGLNSFAIGKLLNVEPSRVDSMMDAEIFDEIVTQLGEAIREAEASSVHGYIAQNALVAAKTVVGGMKNKSADVRIASARDVLDRAGFRPVDRVEHTMKFEDELRIRVIREDEPIPTIDLTIGDE